MIRVLGAPHTRAFRVLWMLEELALDYEIVTSDPLGASDTKRERLLESNPKVKSSKLENSSAKVPVLQDGDLVLRESLAITLYLAQREGALLPGGDAGFAHALQWTLFAATELEPPLLRIARHRVGLPEGERREALALAAEQEAVPGFEALSRGLEESDYLVDGCFGVADLNVASVLAFARYAKMDLTEWPAAEAWLERCYTRAAARRTVGAAIETWNRTQ